MILHGYFKNEQRLLCIGFFVIFVNIYNLTEFGLILKNANLRNSYEVYVGNSYDTLYSGTPVYVFDGTAEGYTSSMGQYVQDGSRLMFETVVTFGETDKDVVIEKEDNDGDGLNFLAGKTMSFVNSKAFEGTVLAHTDGGVPNLVINLDKPDEKNLGELIYFFEKACAISGYMLGVNPFDQPGVESYKKNMFALLGKPGYEAQKAELEARLGK